MCSIFSCAASRRLVSLLVPVRLDLHRNAENHHEEVVICRQLHPPHQVVLCAVYSRYKVW